MPIPVAGIGHVLLDVSDLAQSRDFYTKVLGCEILEEDPDHGGTFMTVAAGSHVIDLHQIENPAAARTSDAATDVEKPAATPGVGHVGFPLRTAEELRDGYFELTDNGVPIVACLDHGSQQSVYFLDPDKNMLEIYWERPGAREMFLAGRSDVDDELIFERP